MSPRRTRGDGGAGETQRKNGRRLSSRSGNRKRTRRSRSNKKVLR